MKKLNIYKKTHTHTQQQQQQQHKQRDQKLLPSNQTQTISRLEFPQTLEHNQR